MPAESEPAGAGTADEVPQWLEDAPVPVDAPDAEWQRLPDGLAEAPESAGSLPAEAMAVLAEAGLAVGAGVETADLIQAFSGTAPSAPVPASGSVSEPADLRAVFAPGDDAGALGDAVAGDQPSVQVSAQSSEALADLQAAFGDAGIASDAPSPTLVESGDASGNQGSEDALADLKSAFGDAGSGPEAQPVLVETGASPSDHGSEDALSELEPAVGELAMDLAMSPAEGKTGLQADAEPIKAPEATGQPALAKAPEAPEASASSPVASAPEQASASAPSAAAGDESSGKRGRPAQDKEGRGKNKSRGRKPGSLLSL
ncbi:MAG: hypothetical protein II132_08045 [Desulfovibrio sp.]|nr:hypothetical protein [Desulfovibrio sp.]